MKKAKLIFSFSIILFLAACQEQQFFQQGLAPDEKTSFDIGDYGDKGNGIDENHDGSVIPTVIPTRDQETNEERIAEGETEASLPVLEESTPIIACTTNTFEEFTQNESEYAPIDILWVVDDSGSMANNQRHLAENFRYFIEDFINKEIDFRMTITTTDPTRNKDGRPINSAHMMALTALEAKQNKELFIRNFQRYINVGTRGYGIEMGLRTSMHFTQRHSAGILRDDAYLAIIYISDEEDQSRIEISEVVRQIQAIKKNPGYVKMYSIVLHNGDYLFAHESVGSRYIIAAELTGGISASLTENFYPILTGIGERIVDLADSFALAKSPFKGKESIRVYVDGELSENDWSFNFESRSIRFSARPSAGAKIRVEYQLPCN